MTEARSHSSLKFSSVKEDSQCLQHGPRYERAAQILRANGQTTFWQAFNQLWRNCSHKSNTLWINIACAYCSLLSLEWQHILLFSYFFLIFGLLGSLVPLWVLRGYPQSRLAGAFLLEITSNDTPFAFLINNRLLLCVFAVALTYYQPVQTTVPLDIPSILVSIVAMSCALPIQLNWLRGLYLPKQKEVAHG